jgi:lysophosphatidate acyltransferase
MLGCVFPPYTSVTAKSSLKYVPFLGQFMALSKTVFINRTSRTAALAAFSQAAETMHTEQQSVFIFPEGTRSYANTPTLLPFKKGAFHLAVQAQVPIIPVVVANYNNVLDVKKKIFNSGSIPVSILKAVETKGLTKDDVDALVERVQKDMADELVRITQVAEKKGVAGSDASSLAAKSSGR